MVLFITPARDPQLDDGIKERSYRSALDGSVSIHAFHCFIYDFHSLRDIISSNLLKNRYFLKSFFLGSQSVVHSTSIRPICNVDEIAMADAISAVYFLNPSGL